MTTEELRESLMAAPKNGFTRINAEQRAEMEIGRASCRERVSVAV